MLRADASAFKFLNPNASLANFINWRRSLRLDYGCISEHLPDDWQEIVWCSAVAKSAEEQAPLFDPLVELEKALHCLESYDSEQFLAQLF